VTPIILTSPKLTELEQKLEILKPKAKASQAEVQRLSKLQYPTAWLDSTVVRVTDIEAPTAAFLGFKPRGGQASVVSTGSKEQDDMASKQDILNRTIAGESFADMPGIKEQLEKAQRQWAAFEDAIGHLTREIEREKDVLAAQYAKSLKPKHDDLMAKLCKSMLDVHAAWSDVYSLKRELIDSGIGLRGLCLNLPESFLSTPANSYSELASFFATAKRDGHIREVPQSLRMKAYR
jgi:hypothetical protein